MLRKSLPSILFLALCVPPLSALDESLVGTWEASGEFDGISYTTRLVYRDDGTFEVSSLGRTEDGYWKLPELVFHGFTDADAEALAQLYREAWPETPLDARSFLGSGTYTTSGDSLRREYVSVDLRFDGRDYTEFMVSHWIQFGLNREAALRASEGDDFPEEDRLALEQELTIQYQDLWTTEAILAALNEPRTTTFELRDGGEVLVLQWPGSSADALLSREADPLAKPLAYRRVDVASGVAPAAWGGVKSTPGP